MNKKSQYLLELAVFGTLLIMLLGVLVNYGMRYNYQQQLMQRTFRRALANTGSSLKNNEPISITSIVIQDRPIPDPATPFVTGSVVPIISQESVTRNYKLQEVPENEEELPVLELDIQDQIYHFKAAGFRVEHCYEETLKRYGLVYGADAWEIGRGGGICKEYRKDYIEDEYGEIQEIKSCINDNIVMRVMDSVEGSFPDYNTALHQCRMIVDDNFCKRECHILKPPEDPDLNCDYHCLMGMEVPWYCTYTYNESTHVYTFPVLDEMFALGTRKFGMQDDFTTSSTEQNVLEKEETPRGIETVTAINWTYLTNRGIIYNDNLDATGHTNETINIKNMTVISNYTQNRTYEWETEW